MARLQQAATWHHDAIVTFNTGREYSQQGQRIACMKLADGRVMFTDVDRNLDGITKWKVESDLIARSPTELERFVMMAYDNGEYTYGAWSTELGLSPSDKEARERLMRELEQAAESLATLTRRV